MDRQVLNKAWLLMNLERPVTGPTYADEYIERWASVYLANPGLRLIGVPFASFLAQPLRFVQYIGNPMRDYVVEPCALRAEEAIAEAERVEGRGENGRLVVKIRHHTYPRSWRNFAPLRDA